MKSRRITAKRGSVASVKGRNSAAGLADRARHNCKNALLPLAIGALSMTAGCASLSERQLEAREYRNVDFAERFRAARRQCLARGGRMYIDAGSKLDRDGIPKRGDRYFCS